MLTKKIVVQAKKCTGCRLCESTCALFNEKLNNPTRSRVQVSRDHSFGLFTPVLCYQCQNPPCVEPCPLDAINRDPEDGIIKVNYDLCIGCDQCAVKCPFGAIITLPDKVIKCELCGGEPQCVKYCETKALEYIEPFKAYQRTREQRAELTFSRMHSDHGLPSSVPTLIKR